MNQGKPFFPPTGWKHVLSRVYTHPNSSARQHLCGLKAHSHLPKLRIPSDSQNVETQPTSQPRCLCLFLVMCVQTFCLRSLGSFPATSASWKIYMLIPEPKEKEQLLLERCSALGYILTNLTLPHCIILI